MTKLRTGKPATNCDVCAYYREDEDTGYSICSMSLDEDEMLYFLKGNFSNCPYFKLYDEYDIVKKQI
ncbi:MAG: DUF6472 family protein [Eubacteriales bacterium]